MTPDPEIRQYLIYDPQSGEFRWAKKCGQRGQVGTIAGTFSHGYRRIKFRGRIYEVHRLAWWWIHEHWPKSDMDHKNLCRSDNRILNLRLASRSRNKANALANKNNTSGFKGVTQRRATGRWTAKIGIDSSNVCLGTYEHPENVARAYDVAATAAFGEFARLNFGAP